MFPLQEMKAYLRSHPQLARKALNAGVAVAQQNPAMTQQVMTAAATAAVNKPARSTPTDSGDNPFDAPSRV